MKATKTVGLLITTLSTILFAVPFRTDAQSPSGSDEIRSLLDKAPLSKDIKGDTTSHPDIIGPVVYYRTFASSGGGSRVVFLVRNKSETRYFYIDSEKPGAEYQLKTLFMTVEHKSDISVWAKGSDKSLVTMIEWYGFNRSGDSRGTPADKHIADQLRTFVKVQEYIGAAKGNYKITASRNVGPAGSIQAPGASACGKTATIIDIIQKGMMIAVGANVGTGYLTDPNSYEYTLYSIVTDPKGKRVVEGSNRITTNNVQVPPEFGYIMRHPNSCPEIGIHKIEVFLFATLSDGNLTLLDRKECTYEITK
jgi:hypothetical protein